MISLSASSKNAKKNRTMPAAEADSFSNSISSNNETIDQLKESSPATSDRKTRSSTKRQRLAAADYLATVAAATTTASIIQPAQLNHKLSPETEASVAADKPSSKSSSSGSRLHLSLREPIEHNFVCTATDMLQCTRRSPPLPQSDQSILAFARLIF